MDQDEFNLLSNNGDEVDLAKDLSITPEPEDLESFSQSDSEYVCTLLFTSNMNIFEFNFHLDLPSKMASNYPKMKVQ